MSSRAEGAPECGRGSAETDGDAACEVGPLSTCAVGAPACGRGSVDTDGDAACEVGPLSTWAVGVPACGRGSAETEGEAPWEVGPLSSRAAGDAACAVGPSTLLGVTGDFARGVGLSTPVAVLGDFALGVALGVDFASAATGPLALEVGPSTSPEMRGGFFAVGARGFSDRGVGRGTTGLGAGAAGCATTLGDGTGAGRICGRTGVIFGFGSNRCTCTGAGSPAPLFGFSAMGWSTGRFLGASCSSGVAGRAGFASGGGCADTSRTAEPRANGSFPSTGGFFPPPLFFF